MMKAVFLDRDGTLIEDMHGSNDLSKIKLLPGVEIALRLLQLNHYKLIVVTNQSSVGRGLQTVKDVIDQHTRICHILAGKNVTIDGYRICPHTPEEGCRCRKPSPNMLFDVAEEYDIDLTESWMIGDRATDVECGYYAGTKTGWISQRPLPKYLAEPTIVDKSLHWITLQILDQY